MNAAVDALHNAKGLPTESREQNDVEISLAAELFQYSDGKILASQVGTTLERLRGLSLALDKQDQLIVATSADQRSRGVYFTPPELADNMVRTALKSALRNVESVEDLRDVAILDPAVGCGAFLLSAMNTAAEILSKKSSFSDFDIAKLRYEIANYCIYGVDIDPVAVATTRALLVAEVACPSLTFDKLDKHLHIGDAISSSLKDWENWFPDRARLGFTVVITNPPWSKLRPLRHEFFEHIDSSVRQLQGKALGQYLNKNISNLLHSDWSDWSDYAQRTIELSSKLRASTEYSVNQKAFGDPDLYKFFIERSIALLAKNGTAALLLPSGILRAKGSTALRKLLRENVKVTEISEYINRKKIFDIHSMYRFTIIFLEKKPGGAKILARFRQTELTVSSSAPSVRLESRFLNVVGGEYGLIPEVCTTEEKNILWKIYRRHSPPKKDSTDRPTFNRELDMTNHSKHFIENDFAIKQGFEPSVDGRWISPTSQDILLPLYEGRMVHQYDHAAKEYQSGQGRSAKWSTPIPGRGEIIPHFFVTECFALSTGWKPKERVGYCEISGHANARTVLAALIPEHAICGNKVSVIKHLTLDDSLLWLAYANSLLVDWIMRRWVSTTINHFYWENIPWPKDLNDADRAFIKSAAAKLSKRQSPYDSPAVWLGKRAQLRAAIDVVIMGAFDISDEEREIILRDFPQLRQAYFRSAQSSLPIRELLSTYARLHGQGLLDLNTVHDVCSSEQCAATYATKSQAAWLNKEE